MHIKRRWLIGLAVVVILMVICHCKITPLVTELAVTRVENQASDVITDAVNAQITDGTVGYDKIVILEKNDSGQVTALKTDMEQANRLRQQVLELVNQRILELNVYDLGIPLGNVLNPTVLSGWGPQIPVRVASVNNASATFESRFTEAGINQTLHQIILQVSMDVDILIAGGTHKTTVTQPVVVAETIIVGVVPEAFLNAEH